MICTCNSFTLFLIVDEDYLLQIPSRTFSVTCAHMAIPKILKPLINRSNRTLQEYITEYGRRMLTFLQGLITE